MHGESNVAKASVKQSAGRLSVNILLIHCWDYSSFAVTQLGCACVPEVVSEVISDAQLRISETSDLRLAFPLEKEDLPWEDLNVNWWREQSMNHRMSEAATPRPMFF